MDKGELVPDDVTIVIESARVPGGYKAGIYKQEGYVDIGIGLKPALTEKENGLFFINQCMNYLTNQGEISRFQLVVAVSMKREEHEKGLPVSVL